MRVINEKSTYANRVYVLIDTTRDEVNVWATKNCPTGWKTILVTPVRNRPNNFTVRFNRGF